MTRAGRAADAPGAGPGERAAPFADLPAGWRLVRARGPGRFVTHALLERPDGVRVEWTSRRHRKRLGLRGGPAGGAPGASAVSVWLAVLFGTGSVCFALGSVPAYFDHVPVATVAWTFFVGSLFFTTAAAVQLAETVRAPAVVLDDARRGVHRRRAAARLHWHPHRIDWWASLVQLVGTVLFNVSTFAATRTGLDLAASKHLVWAPDVYGSVCFLVASWLAYAEVNRGVLPRPDRSWGWWIAGLNLAGSIAFGASAVGARYVGATAEPANVTLVNLGTFAGAVCFLVGAALLPVEQVRDRATEPA